MAQCLCFSIVNDTPNPLIYTYTDCVTGEFFDNVPIDGNTTVYTCSSNGVTSNGAIVSINANDTPCGGCECGCETFTGFIYKGAGGTISITYTNCNNFTGTITNIIVPPSADGGGNQSTYLFAEHFPFSEQPALCAKVGTSITHTGGSIGLFVPQFDGCCSIVNHCYSWTVNAGDILPSLDVSYTNFEGVYIDQVEVLTNILVNQNIDGTFTYYVCSSTEPEFFEGGLPVVPSFNVLMGETCESDLQCNSSPSIIYLVSDCCGEKPDGYMELPVGLDNTQVVGSSTDNTCYKIVSGETAVATLTWDGSVFDYGCSECQEKQQYFCQQDPPTPTPTKTQTPTPTPTITPTPTLTPTPTSQPKIIYFQRCCNVGQYFGIFNYDGGFIPEYSYFSITLGTITHCVKLVSSAPSTTVLYDYNSIELNVYDSCEECKDEHPCPPLPSSKIIGYSNECNVITIFPMEIECISESPSKPESNDGLVSVSITGGTPPYKYTWTGINIGNNNHAPAIENVPAGDYTVTVIDYWGDFTATTICTLSARTDCSFSGTVSEFTPPTPTPTMTMTPTPSSIPSRCDCRYGNVYISQIDVNSSDDGAVYVSYQDCNGQCYCLTTESNNAIPYPSGTTLNDICIDVTTNTGIGVSLFILVNGDYELLPINGNSYVTLGGCCSTPIP